MATTTANYNLIKPTMAESADIRTINGNMDTIDDIMHASQVSLADAYDSTETYNKDDVVMYQYLMYKCKEDNVTGQWDATKWERTTAGENGAGGTEVEANPSGTPSADLAKLGINGIIYGIPSGDEVEANPSGTGDTDLTKLGINGTVYNIPSGGGGSGSGYSEKTLFEQPYNTAFPSTITLSESFENFDALGFYLTKSDDSNYYDYLPVDIFTKSALTEALNGAISGRTNTLCITGWQLNNSQYVRLQVDSTTQLTIPVSGGAWNLNKITGIKFGIGGSGGSGYNATLLYDSGSLVNGAPYEQDVALLDNLSNYDMALLILGNPSDLGQANTAATATVIIDTSFTLTDSAAPYYDLHWAGYDKRWLISHFTDTTFNVRNHGGDVNETIYRIYGIKFSGGGSGNANYTELTQAEYDALTPEEQMNGTIYFITDGSGGGSGGEGYSETSLWSGSDSATMQLSESFENYDAIMIIATASTQQGNYRLTNIWSVDYLKNHINDGVRFGLTGDAWYIYFSITDSTTFTRQDQNITYISEIKGLKFGVGGSSESINYSTEEQDTGIKWIDGKTIYQKTFSFSDGDYQLQRNSWTAISSVSIPTLENVVDIRMIGYDTANNKYPAVEDGCSKRFINGVLNYYLDKDFPIYLRAVTVQYTKSTT